MKKIIIGLIAVIFVLFSTMFAFAHSGNFQRMNSNYEFQTIIGSGDYNDFQEMRTNNEYPMMDIIETEEEFQIMKDWHNLMKEKESYGSNFRNRGMDFGNGIGGCH